MSRKALVSIGTGCHKHVWIQPGRSTWLHPRLTMATGVRSNLLQTQKTFKRQRGGAWRGQEGQRQDKAGLDVCGVRGRVSWHQVRGLRAAGWDRPAESRRRREELARRWRRWTRTGRPAERRTDRRVRLDAEDATGTSHPRCDASWPPPSGASPRMSRLFPRRSGPAGRPPDPSPPAPTGPGPGLAASKTGRSRTGCLTCPSCLSLRTKTEMMVPSATGWNPIHPSRQIKPAGI